MNDYDLHYLIRTCSPEQREIIFEEVQNKPIGNEYYCKYFSCERKGECEISYDVCMRGGITEEVWELCELPLKTTGVIVEQRVFVEMNGIVAHRIYKSDNWEEIWTIDDIIIDYSLFGTFVPSIMEEETFCKVYDYDGNQISEKREKVPFPMERMSENIREEYEEWKKDPIKWEENKEKERLETRFNDTQPSDDDDLPF